MKHDLSRAFRQFPMDPGDYNSLGWSWKSAKYFDKALSMGMNISPYMCQSVTDAVKYIYQGRGFDLVNYLDNVTTAKIWDKAQEADDELCKVIEESGLQDKTVKHCVPNHCMVFLGVLFDTQSLTLSVTEDRVQEIMEILES